MVARHCKTAVCVAQLFSFLIYIQHYCRQHNSHIVKIDSAEENSFLKGYIMSLVGMYGTCS